MTKPQKTKLAIIGSGPAGFTAAIYAARAELAPILIAGLKAGGQLMFTSVVENFPGFEQGKNGPDLMIEMRQQAARFGTQILDTWATAVDLTARPFKVWTNLPAELNPTDFDQTSPEQWQKVQAAIKQTPPAIEADSIIISTGAASIIPPVAGGKKLLGKGIATCAVCDAAFFRDKITFVVGGGDSAMEDALALAKFAQSVTIIHRRDSFKASKIMQDRVLNHPKIKVLWNSQVLAAEGETHLTKILVENVETKTQQTLAADGLFFAIGHKPLTQLFADQIELDTHGYIVTGQSPSQNGLAMAQKRLSAHGLVQYPSMTSVEGVFAAGDVVDVRYKQAITSAGQGTSAALDVERWLETQK